MPDITKIKGIDGTVYNIKADNADTLDGKHASDFLLTSGGTITGSISRSSGGAWIKGRDNAVVKQTKVTATEGTSWNPVISVKTAGGNWTLGNDGGNNLKLSYDTDTNYDAGTNSSSVINFPSAGSTGTLALTSQIPTSLPANGGNSDTVDGYHASSFTLYRAGLNSFNGNEIGRTDKNALFMDGMGVYYINDLCGDSSHPFAFLHSYNTDYYILNMPHAESWGGQYAFDFRTGLRAFRRKENGNWSVWYYNTTYLNNHDTNIDAVGDTTYIQTAEREGGVWTGSKPYGSHNGIGIINLHTHTGYYSSQLCFDTNQNRLWFRSANDSTAYGSWSKVAYTSDITGYNDIICTGYCSWDPTTRTLSKTVDNNSWDSQAYSSIGYVSSCSLSFKASSTHGYKMIGLDSNPAEDTGYGSIDYCWYLTQSDNHVVEIYENGTSIGSYGTYSSGDEFRIEYDGSYIRYYKNGIVSREVKRNISDKLYFDSSFYNACSIYDLEFKPIAMAYGGATHLYADDPAYRVGEGNPYFAHMSWNVNSDSRWYLRVYPETPKQIAVDHAYTSDYGVQSHYLRTFSANDTSHGNDYLVKVKHNVNSDDRFRAYIVRSHDGSTSHQIRVSAADYADSAGSAPANGGTSTNAEYLAIDAGYARFHWNGQGGQPTWLWGGNDDNHTNMYVYNPSNFSVNYANSAGNADTVDGRHARDYVYVCRSAWQDASWSPDSCRCSGEFNTGMIFGGDGSPTGSAWNHYLTMGWNPTESYWSSQIAICPSEDGKYFRWRSGNGGWNRISGEATGTYTILLSFTAASWVTKEITIATLLSYKYIAFYVGADDSNSALIEYNHGPFVYPTDALLCMINMGLRYGDADILHCNVSEVGYMHMDTYTTGIVKISAYAIEDNCYVVGFN